MDQKNTIWAVALQAIERFIFGFQMAEEAACTVPHGDTEEEFDVERSSN